MTTDMTTDMTRDPRTRHRPDDPTLLRKAAIELMRYGLTLTDAAQAIGMTARALDTLLADIEEQTYAAH